jgi:hypothetical protein
MTAARVITSIPWGDRSRLLPKTMSYAFSLDVRFTCHGPYLEVQPSKRSGVRHLFEDSIVTLPEGRCDVPSGRVIRGDGEIGDSKDPTSNWLFLRVRTLVGRVPAPLYFECRGVVNFDGGLAALRAGSSPGGSAFLSSIHEASTGTFRWLERRQLFGVGRIQASEAADAASEAADVASDSVDAAQAAADAAQAACSVAQTAADAAKAAADAAKAAANAAKAAADAAQAEADAQDAAANGRSFQLSLDLYAAG